MRDSAVRMTGEIPAGRPPGIALTDSDTVDGTRYSYAIDPLGDSTANKVLRLVGEGKRVLELGCGPGTMTRYLYEQAACQVTAVEFDPELARHAEPYCQRLLVVNLETLDFASAFGETRFDVIIAADVLEHLRDPWACLRQVRDLIAPEGYLVVSIPNVAHAGVIAQLLGGRFPYSERGLLDSTHLRFFSRHDVEDLLLATGYLPVIWERNRVLADDSEFAYAWQRLPATVRDALMETGESDTYQYIVKAQVSDAAGWAAKARAERSATEVDYQRLQVELTRTRGSLEEHQKAFSEAKAIIADRDEALAGYTKAFHEARDTLEAKIKELHEVNSAFGEARGIIARLQQENADLREHLGRTPLVWLKGLGRRLLGYTRALFH